MESLRGQLLISSGGLYDPNFRHTVVLLGDHDVDGAFGVVINRRLNLTVADAVPELAPLVGAATALYSGGPVRPSSPVLLAELDRPELADVPVFGDVGFLVGDVPIEAKSQVRRARLFVGYSGWGPGQLEAELDADSWIVEPALTDDVFTDEPGTLWARVLQRKGPRYHWMSQMPFDPRTN